jgi:Family of unknown function (DUF6090)
MEDEIGKHTKEILSVVKEKNHTVSGKFLKIVTEIGIIVFSILISLALDDWNDNRRERKEVKEFLTDLKVDLNKDIKAMTDEKKSLVEKLESFENIKKLTPQELKKLGFIELNVRFITRRTNSGNFEGFKSSGKIGFIENKDLKKSLLEYYYENMPPLEEIEKLRNNKMDRFLELMSENNRQAITLKNPKVQGALMFAESASKKLIEIYDEDIKFANDILLKIDADVR